MNLKGKTVTIVGAGRSGFAAARLAAQHHATVKLTDSGESEGIVPEFKQWLDQHGVVQEFSDHTEEFIAGSDLVVVSPGVTREAQPVQWAKAKGIDVIGELEFGFRFCRAPIIAVTGSNGKTTVSTLIARVCEAAGKKVCLCGNIGHPFSQFVLEDAVYDYYVIEVSSFQLETISTFRAHVAVFLNFCENHLDRHADLDEYFDMKRALFAHQTSKDFAVLNGDDERIKSLDQGLPGQIIRFYPSLLKETNAHPQSPAVLAVAQALHIDGSLVRTVLKEFKGVEHRLEWVRSLKGVDFINDSKATTAHATRWALEHIEQPIVMICGGRDKKINFSEIRDTVQKKVKKIFIIGEAREKIKQSFEGCADMALCGGLDEAVTQAGEAAQKGDCVLFSPMCSSFDMFRDFEHRGESYKDIVQSL